MKDPGMFVMNPTNAEIKLAQVLSANDRNIRLSGLRKLTAWLTARASSEETLSDAELSHVWVGLHYCLWMQDKPLLQEELIQAFGGLFHHLGEHGDVALRFFDAFLELECREWLAIDRHRLDKYLLLVRTILNSTLTWLAKAGWQQPALDKYLEIFRKRLTRVSTSEGHDGLKFHIADLFVEELSKIEAEFQIPQLVTHRLLDPYCELLSTHECAQMLTKVKRRVFKEIIDQAQAHLLALQERQIDKEGDVSMEMEVEEEEAMDDGDELPVCLNLDLEQLADRLMELRCSPKVETTPANVKKRSKAAPDAIVIRNRKLLKSVANELRRGAKFNFDEFDEEDFNEWEQIKAARGNKKSRKRRQRDEQDAQLAARKRQRILPLEEVLDEESFGAVDERELRKAVNSQCALRRPVRNDEADEELSDKGTESVAITKTKVKRVSKIKRKQLKKKAKKRKGVSSALLSL